MFQGIGWLLSPFAILVPPGGRPTESILALGVEVLPIRSLSLVVVVGPLLNLMLLSCIDLAVGLIDGCTFSTGALRYPLNRGSLNSALIVIDAPNAVIVCVTDVDLYVSPLLVVERGNSAWLVKARLKRCLVVKFVFPVS